MIEIPKTTLQKVLQSVIGAVERKQTLAILGNVLLRVKNNQLTLTATDLEIELTASCELEADDVAITLPARKLLDILKNLSDDVFVKLEEKNTQIVLKAGRSRFKLSTLPANDFPVLDAFKALETITLPTEKLKALIDGTQFAMANQDARYYLNGLFLELDEGRINTVATDGHRLAFSSGNGLDRGEAELRQIILPRKGVGELSRLLALTDAENVSLSIGESHLKVDLGSVQLVSKLIDGKYPEYKRAIPSSVSNVVTADRSELVAALSRTTILSGDKRGVRLVISENQVAVQAHNMEQETADEEVTVEYTGEPMEVGFCATYLLDALGNVSGDKVEVCFSSPDTSCLIRETDNSDRKFVVSPMML